LIGPYLVAFCFFLLTKKMITPAAIKTRQTAPITPTTMPTVLFSGSEPPLMLLLLKGIDDEWCFEEVPEEAVEEEE